MDPYNWEEIDTEHSRAVILSMRMALEPLLARIAPGWAVHHLEMKDRRTGSFRPNESGVDLVINIRPLGDFVYGDERERKKAIEDGRNKQQSALQQSAAYVPDCDAYIEEQNSPWWKFWA